MSFDQAMVGTVASAATAAGVPVPFALGIAQQESAFNPGAVSRAGALGLMQVMPKTADWMMGRAEGTTTPQELLDPVFNAAVGTKFLAWLLNRYGGDAQRAAAAYNAGPGRVPVSGDWDTIDASLPSETKGYWRKVLNFASAWSGGVSQLEAKVANVAADVETGFTDQAKALGWDEESGAVKTGLLLALGVLAVILVSSMVKR